MATIDIITHKMIFGGKSLGKFNEKSVFIPFSLPEETLRVEITRNTRGYDEAKIIEILKPSPRRVRPPCPLYQKCGGCNIMHADYNFQLELKKQIMLDTFARAGVKLPQIKVISKNPLGYRNRMEFLSGGLQERTSNNVIALDNCPVAAPEINRWLSEVPQKSRPKERAIVFGSDRANPNLTIAEISSTINPPKSGAAEKIRRGKKFRACRNSSQTISQNPVEINLCGKKISFDAKGFFQSNVGMLELAIPMIMEGLSGNHALDLYSGCGTFSVFLAERFSRVTMVEHNKGAVVFAEQNMAGVPHSTFAVSGANFVKYHAESVARQGGDFDLVFADPPRSGMEKEVCDWLCESGIPKISYLSCDTATQARDVARFEQNGYSIEEAWLLDFYPQTSHLETFLTCVKK